ncbi:MAG: hypothetical protein RQ758_03930 [Methanomicrobiaceae archaeon]|nr:hypothetical protein [Methanomicrobiaceae archaeon]
MKKRVKILVRSLGSDLERPAAEELAAWIARRRREPGDLLTYALMRSLDLQKEVDVPCTGGRYYGERWAASIIGLSGGVLSGEPATDPETIREDTAAIMSVRRQSWVAVPPPSSLGITDRYFHDQDECEEALCECYRGLAREMRDAGVYGHVLVGDRFSEIEREELGGRKKIFLFLRDPDTAGISGVLEVQDSIAVPGTLIESFGEVFEEYEPRSIIITDPGEGDVDRALAWFDPGEILVGGYCPEDCTGYWKGLVEQSVLLL